MLSSRKAFLLPLVEPCDGPKEHDEAAEEDCSCGGVKKPKNIPLAISETACARGGVAQQKNVPLLCSATSLTVPTPVRPHEKEHAPSTALANLASKCYGATSRKSNIKDRRNKR